MSKQETVRVWDPLVRIFHWSLVLFFTIAYLTGEEESAVHVYSGYIVIGLVVFRLLWGFVGTKHARFRDFVVGPSRALAYTRALLAGRPPHYLGHNPPGGWMIIALLASVLVTGWSGLEVQEAEEAEHRAEAGAPTLFRSAYADEDDESNEYGGGEASEEFWEELHEGAANFTILLVLLHLAGVGASSLLHRENLVRAMITGNKTRP